MLTLLFCRLASLRVLAAGAALCCLATFAAAKPVKFDIPAQPAGDALITFSKQSGMDVLYAYQDLQAVRSPAVAGEMEPDQALTRLLKNTGFTATQDSGKFVVTKAKAATAGAIKGSLTGESGQILPNVLVAIRETGQGVETDKHGQYVFPKVAAGTYVIVATAPGYQPLHITDVAVKAGGELLLGQEAMRKAGEGPLALEPFVVHAETVEELDKFEVTGTKQALFSSNMDVPRTVNDAQPYYIFDSKTIDQSGAINVADLLKQRLTMNTTALSSSQAGGINTLGNTSSINLRGLGADKTLILVNGRRTAGVTLGTVSYQPDLNGIPMNSIERIEVLPSSASGIYGGSAIGGVVNVILKKDYAGGEIRATYDNTFDSDSPTRTVSASYGLALEGGKTHVTMNASWSDAQSLLLQDRQAIFKANVATINKNSPGWFASGAYPFLGALPNIINESGTYNSDFTIYTADKLVLKPAYGGTVLNSGLTYVPAGTSNATSLTTLGASLAANAGSQSFDLPRTTQAFTGLLRPFGVTPENKSVQVSVNRQMLSKLELFADFSYSENNSSSLYNPPSSVFELLASSPASPFTTDVQISTPDAAAVPLNTESTNRGFTVGAMAHLPWNWTGELDYSWSKNQYSFLYYTQDSSAINAALASGAINPFVDTIRYPLNFKNYLTPSTFGGATTLHDIALRASGPLWSLPWGAPNLTVGLERRTSETPDSVQAQIFPITATSSTIVTTFGRRSVTDSGYGEVTVPLMKKGALPFVHALELQASGRSERYTVDAGTPSSTFRPSSGVTTFAIPNLSGLRYDTRAHYTSTNGTIGLKFQPIPELTLRASQATAFLPPTPAQLVKNPAANAFRPTVTDPTNGTRYAVSTISGGNPSLKPQNSKSRNAGLIWEPRADALKGLRLNVEYYRIEQEDAIGALALQTLVNLESTFPGRVTRDSAGKITLVDLSSINLYKRTTEGWDLSANYTLKTAAGTFNLMAVESIIQHLQNQYALTLPAYEAAGFPAESGAAKYKSNVTLTWDWHNWTASWTVRHFGSYKQYGAVGGPDSTQNYSGAADPTWIAPQGGDTIPAQTYHDLFISYAFGKQHAKGGSGLRALGASVLDSLTVQLGIRNVFDKVPPLDLFYDTNYYESPYGDMRLRSYWLSVKKTF